MPQSQADLFERGAAGGEATFENVSPAGRSGRTGGAGTGRGVSYQTRYATLHALILLQEYRHDTPLNSPVLHVEPRLLDGNDVTRWDLSVARPGADCGGPLMVEAKVAPRKKDVLDALRECRRAIEAGADVRFEFAHGSPAAGELGVLGGLEKLRRLAAEAGEGNDVEFRRLCRLETDPALEDVLEVLGSAALTAATRFRAEYLTGEALDREITRNLAQTAAAGSRDA